MNKLGFSKSVHVLRQKNTLTYYSDVLDDRHCIYGFTHKKHAVLFTCFLNDFKRRYNRYPSPEQTMFSTKFLVNTDPVFIEEVYMDEMKIRCIVNGLHLFEVHKFDYDDITEISLTGSHVTEGIEVLPEHSRMHLDEVFRL